MTTATQKVDPPDGSSYYDLHICKPCADAPVPTPLELGIEVMQARNIVTPSILKDEDFSAGWHMGIESSPYDPRPEKTGLMPLDDDDRMRNWLIGFVAGRYADEFQWGTPHCRHLDEDGHQEA